MDLHKDLELSLTDSIDLDDVASVASTASGLSGLSTESDVVLDAVDPSSIDGVSNDLTDAIDLDSSTKADAIATAQSLITEFEEVTALKAEVIKTNAFDAVFLSSNKSEEYIKSLTQRLYDEIHKQSKLFLKDWCKINSYDQTWSNPFLKHISRKLLNATSEFIPQAYTITAVNRTTNDAIILAELQPTPREASIIAAKRVGFDNSTRRALAFSKFPKDVVEIILTQPKFLKEARELHRLEEHRKQVESRPFLPAHVRSKWLKEINDKLTQINGLI